MDTTNVTVSPLRRHRDHQVLEVAIRGAFDPSTAPAIAAKMQDALPQLDMGGVLVLDGTELAFMNSVSIGMLITWHLELQERGARIVLVGFQPQVLDVLATTGITQILASGATLDDALDMELPSTPPTP